MANIERETILIAETEIPAGEPPVPELPPDVALRRPRKVYAGMWGIPEIAAVAVSALAVLLALVVYIFFVIPSNREVARNRGEAERLAAERISANSKYGEITDTKQQVAKLLESVDDFETRFLPAAVNGRAALYQRLNALIMGYGLTNTTGPDYLPLETADQTVNNQSEEERGRAKYRSLFPGIYVTVTVEGSYQNIRRFIRDLETGNEFVIISTVELEPSDSEAQQQNASEQAQLQPNGTSAGPIAAPQLGSARGIAPGIAVQQPGQTSSRSVDRGKMHGEIVALHIEMAAYFRRANYAPLLPAGTEQ